jgi:NADH dehydrogenase
VILLTGATGTVGAAVLRRLTASGTPVRCLVRDPRKLGSERVRVQIALGDLGNPASFRHAMRGVKTVVHLAGSIRDQPGGSIEELNAVATWRMMRAAERAGVERFIFFSTLSASPHGRARFLRAKAIAERAVAESAVPHVIFAPSLVYAAEDPWLRLLERASLVTPMVPLAGRGRAMFQPIWAEDVADCVVAALDGRADGSAGAGVGRRYELAGPETLSTAAITELALRSLGRRRPLLRVPLPIARRGLRLIDLLLGPAAPVTWEEAELLDIARTSASGTADAQSLGVTPRPMAAVLGGGG